MSRSSTSTLRTVPAAGFAPLEASLPGVVIGLTRVDGPHAHPAASLCDLVLSHGDAAVERVLATVAAVPLASRAFVIHMRAPIDTVAAGLAAESAVYSTLQSGPEFAAWRAGAAAAGSAPRRASRSSWSATATPWTSR